MPGHYSERRYSDEEMRQIFAEAARATVATTDVTKVEAGYTLPELRQIGEEVGIPPAEIDRAAANLVASLEKSDEPSPTLLSFRRLVAAERIIPGRLAEEEMLQMAQRASQLLGRPGMLSQTPNWVEWQDEKGRLYVGIVRGHEQVRVRIIADQTHLLLGAGGIGVVGLGVMGTIQGFGPYLSVLLLTLVAAVTFGVMHLFWGWRTKAAGERLEELLGKLESSVQVP